MKIHPTTTSLAVILFSGLGLVRAGAALTWVETFDHGDIAGQPDIPYPSDWSLANGNNGTLVTPTLTQTRIAGGDSATGSSGAVKGFVFDPSANLFGRNLWFTTSDIPSITVQDLEMVQFHTMHGTGGNAPTNTGFLFSFAILVDEQWYRIEDSYNSGTWTQWTITDFTSQNWRPLTFDPGTELSSGNLSTNTFIDQDGEIQGWGFYGFQPESATGANNIRFDALSITYSTVPEPSSAVLLGGLGVLGLLSRRRS